MLLKRLKKVLKNPGIALNYILVQRIARLIPDKALLKMRYRIMMGKSLNLKKPQTYNEKLQWLKLYDRKSEYTQMVDKYEVRKYISETIGEEYLIPLLGVYDSFDEINFNFLPNQFVLKPNHTSGDIFICRDKSKINYLELENRVEKWMKRDFYWLSREWQYKNIKPRIICEQYMVDESGVELKDYKFFCFDGKPKAMFVATDRWIDTRFDFYDMEFNHLPFTQHYKNATKKILRPKGFDKMVELAIQLSKDISHVRVDFYDINGKIYFGELTFTHFSGFEKFDPEEWDFIFGSWIKLPNKNRS